MHRLLWKIYKLASRHLSRRVSYALVSAVELIAPWTWTRPLASARGTWDVVAEHPRLASPAYRISTSLRPTALCLAMSGLGSDKSLFRHNYTQLYDVLLGGARHDIATLFELGIGSIDPLHAANMGPLGTPGASLRGWREYLPGARIFAADIDRAALIEEQRIQSFHCDQTDPASIEAMWREPALAGPVDVIIDDGMHEYHANVCFLEHSLHRLRPGGLLVIEDVKGSDLPAWERYLPGSIAGRDGRRWAIVRLAHPFNAFDNNVVLVRTAQ